MPQLSILIPSRNEEFLKNTVEDILSNIEADTEILVALDGEWSNPPLNQHERVTVIHFTKSLGQRAAANRLARLARGKYVMKVDAHCSFDKGFDRKMVEAMKGHDNWTMVPVMKNLHIFDWVCECGWRNYQGPTPPKCPKCGGKVKKDVVWFAKRSPNSTSYRFDKTLHFQYWGGYAKRPEAQEMISETLSLQGSCFMMTKEKYLELNICDESWGSWGNQGTEVACKTWLSGGRVVCNKNTWYAHCFRTQGGDFSFPYPNPGRQIEHAREMSREAFLEGRWDKAIYPLSWLIEKFAPVPDWGKIPESAKLLKQGPSKGIIYYTDNLLPENINNAVRGVLTKASKEKKIRLVSSSLKKIEFGDKNIHFPSLKRSFETMAKQILAALENSSSDIIYFCEHDVLYSNEHFDFVPPRKDRFYYNQNFWKLRMTDGFAIHFDANQLSGLCAYRELVLKEYEKIVAYIEKNGFSRKALSFEPGTRDDRWESWKSTVPIVDLRHGDNATPERWKQSEFKNQAFCQGWLEGYEIPVWGKGKELIENINHLDQS